MSADTTGRPVDLRSDTVTRPTPAMRRAMAEAEVGDDVIGDDPTVKALERRVAETVGKEAALFVPSGTMGNQIAVKVHTEPGDEVLLEERCHIFLYEQGGVGANSGCLAHPLASARGAIAPEAIEKALRGADDHVARIALLCLENTHNAHGGALVPQETVAAAASAARARGLAVHLDGARLWNASRAAGVSLKTLAAPADSVMMCFSKGLGAPIGSIVAGSGAFVRAARRVRKRWGGGMRQVGIIAAAALHALDHHFERLDEDHARAKTLAAAIARVPGVSVVPPDTNIVIARLDDAAIDAARLLAGLASRGVLMSAFGAGRLRAVTHLDVDDAAVERAAASFPAAVEAARGAAVDAPGPPC